MNSVFKTNGPKQIKSALHLWLFSFSKIQEISAYPSDRADVKNHLLWTFKAQQFCHPFKINSQLFHCLEPYTDTDRVLAEANPAKDQLSYAVRIVWRPSWLLPHLKKKKKITMTDSKEVTRVISRLSARTLHVFQITLQHCTTKKYAEIFHLKWRLKIKH